jgi:N-acetylmuramoyl-L-alanine amidase
MFYVLVGARMPAVLVEASFVTYEPEARALTKRQYRRALADGIASGIASYLLAR